MDSEQIRLECLHLALEFCKATDADHSVTETAEVFYAYVTTGKIADDQKEDDDANA